MLTFPFPDVINALPAKYKNFMRYKMKHSLLILSLFWVQTVFAQKGFVVLGTVPGTDTGMVYLTDLINIEKIDSAVIKNGSFSFKGPADPARLYALSLTRVYAKMPRLFLFLDNSTVKVELNKAQLKDSKATGSRTVDEYRHYLKMVEHIDTVQRKLGLQYNAIPEDNTLKRDSIRKEFDILEDQRYDSIAAFVRRYQASEVSPFLINGYLMSRRDMSLPESLYNILDPAIHSNSFAKQVRTKLDIENRLAPGKVAPDFKQKDTSGNIIALKDFRGKYVLVDFWASWCAPCRSENPNLVRAFNEYKDRNFTILGVSFDKTGAKGSWLNAIHKDGLTWTHVSDLKGWENEAGKLYGINLIPSNVLIDPSGKIIARNLTGDKLQQKLKELLQ